MTSLAGDVNPAALGAMATFTAKVHGTAPSVGVIFTDGGTPINGCTSVSHVGGTTTRLQLAW